MQVDEWYKAQLANLLPRSAFDDSHEMELSDGIRSLIDSVLTPTVAEVAHIIAAASHISPRGRRVHSCTLPV